MTLSLCSRSRIGREKARDGRGKRDCVSEATQVSELSKSENNDEKGRKNGGVTSSVVRRYVGEEEDESEKYGSKLAVVVTYLEYRLQLPLSVMQGSLSAVEEAEEARWLWWLKAALLGVPL
uniref:Uncharacterized protein n=1 Tax=Brassica oleracea TaxID=3712 RepID=A0A3P6BEK2_BRAOL|nr:unnamed protein product [Brassica oleracea]